MTDRQRDLVRHAWEHLRPHADLAVEIFYADLFRRDPALRDFIGEKLSAQKPPLVPALDTLVRGLDDLDTLLPAVRQLGRHRAEHGLHYAAPGALRAALLHTLHETLGPLFTPEVRQACIAVHDLVAATARSLATA